MIIKLFVLDGATYPKTPMEIDLPRLPQIGDGVLVETDFHRVVDRFMRVSTATPHGIYPVEIYAERVPIPYANRA